MIAADEIRAHLRDLGIEKDDTVFVHSELRSALRVAGETPKDKMATIISALEGAVSDGVLILPTFTYSFCKGDVFDVRESPSRVGVLSEYFRRLPGVRRTRDPLFSSAVRGPLPPEWERALFQLGDKDCFGEESIFAFLRASGSKLLFFGVEFAACTFVHHVEQRIGVPYRYTKDFAGTVRDGDRSARVIARYFVRPLDGDVEVYLDPLGDSLLQSGGASTVRISDGPTMLRSDTDSIESMIRAELASNPDFLLRRGHPDAVPAGEGAS